MLAEASSAKSNQDDDITDIPTLVEEIKSLKSKLKLANSQIDQPVNVEGISDFLCIYKFVLIIIPVDTCILLHAL